MPSGNEITYASLRGGNLAIVSKASGGNGEANLLVGTPLNEGTPDWSPDQRFLIYETNTKETGADLLYRERGKGGKLGEPVVFLKTHFNEGAAKFSPDGHFVVYMSNESGRAEIYVRDFPNGTNKWQISANGGIAPRWRRDGKEIFYVELPNKLMAVSVT